MNRRSAILSAIVAAVAGVWPWQRKRTLADFCKVTVSRDDSRLPDPPIALPCWQCGHESIDTKCPKCGHDSGIQPDGSYLVPQRFNPVLEAKVITSDLGHSWAMWK